jgi:hypothetical protein
MARPERTPHQRVSGVFLLIAVNVVLLLLLVARASPIGARGDAPVLRGRALEIVDERGRVRASIQVHPAHRAPDGQSHPDTVVLRLIDPEGRPEVKLGASERGAGLGLVGLTDRTHALLEARDGQVRLRLTNDDGRERRVEP